MISAPVATSAANDTIIVAAQAGKKIRVHSWILSNGAASAQNVKWRRSNGTDLTGLFYSTGIGIIGSQDGGTSRPGDQYLFECATGEALWLNLSAATAVGGVVQYTQF